MFKKELLHQVFYTFLYSIPLAGLSVYHIIIKWLYNKLSGLAGVFLDTLI